MRLNMTTTEVVHYLRKRKFLVDFPVHCELGDECARVGMKGGHFVIVTRDDDGQLHVSLETKESPVENLSYYDLVVIAATVEKHYDNVHAVWADACGVDKEVAGECADELNKLSLLKAKLNRILRAERSAQYAAEAREIISS